MKEKPILFSGEMVRAILDGRKTQTRRVVKYNHMLGEPAAWCGAAVGGAIEPIIGEYQRFCPYGAPGDRLWVRETHQFVDTGTKSVAFAADGKIHPCSYGIEDMPMGINPNISIPDVWDGNWRPSIFMPRWASRITLEVTAVRVERVQDISPKDALAEGDVEALTNPRHKETSIDWYHNLWDSINGAGSWASNPWVWVVEFRRIEQ